jgi:hypothetical protein
VKRTGYQALGFVVWHGAKWYVRRRVLARAPVRPLLAGAAVAAAIGVALVVGRRG